MTIEKSKRDLPPPLPAPLPHPAPPALRRRLPDRQRLPDLTPCRPDMVGHVEHPGPQFRRVVAPVPGSVTRHDEAVLRPDAGLLLDQYEVGANLSAVRVVDSPSDAKTPTVWLGEF
jgi:hypothetical protein